VRSKTQGNSTHLYKVIQRIYIIFSILEKC